MTTLAAVPGVDGVTLTVSPADVVVTRLDANGLRVVRRPAGQPLTWVDYEAPMTGSVRYLAQSTGSDPASVTVTAVTNGLPQLRRVFDPAVKVLPIVATMSATATLTATEHRLIGRSDTIFTTYGYGKRRGAIVYACASYADAVAVRRLYSTGAPALLRFPEYAGADVYHVSTDRSDAQDDLAPVKGSDGVPRWLVTVGYAEVEPSALTTIAAWTLRDVATTYPTLGVAALAYATLGDMAANNVGTL